MIDFGLLLSVILAFGIPALLARWWPLRSSDFPGHEVPVGFIDLVLGPAAGGVVVGRLATLALDDPSSIGKLQDMLIIRSGVEFWPGALAAVALAAWSVRKSEIGVWVRLAALAPLSMVGYAAYEASCVFRSGCAGPVSSIGLRPDGVGARVLPVGILMGLGVVLGAWILRRWVRAQSSPVLSFVASVVVIAGVRSIGSFWLPKLGEGLTRQHQTSLIIAGLAVLAVGTLVLRSDRSAKIDAKV